jgi:hypothetical protein
MGRFAPRANPFGRRVADEDEEDAGIPSPKLMRQRARRMAGITEARQIISMLPGPEESLHCIITSRIDLAVILDLMIAQLGACRQVAIATLSYSPRNLKLMMGWCDTARVEKLWLVSSNWFRANEPELWSHTQQEFRDHGQRCCCCENHCKIACLHFVSGIKMVLEGSGNLRANGGRKENVTFYQSAELHDHHAATINAWVEKHETQTTE